MTTHLTARLAWHMDGWNGSICRSPGSNTYCVGPHSYPGDKIKAGRDLAWESDEKVAGKPCASLDQLPPCIHTINAFGTDTLTAFDDPPEFFRSGERTQWALPPATVCVWPYETMYNDEARTDGRVDNDKRLELAKAYFSEIDEGSSLVFHYANYSNPLSEEDAKRFVVVGISRVKKLGQITYYKGTDEETKKRYGGAYVWQMNVETLYPDEGLRIPYHRYLHDLDVLEAITLVPENPRCFKYGSRHVSDDDALSLVERLIEIVTYLQTIGDDSENWSVRLQWLNSLVAELWHSRGLYPGLARVLDLVEFDAAIGACREAVANGHEQSFRDDIFAWLDGDKATLLGVLPSKDETNRIRRNWKLRTEDERRLLADVLPRFDLPKEQLERIISDSRAANGLDVDLADIFENPYLICERFVGNDPDDIVPLSRIDHGVFPSPELGGAFLFDTDDPRRLRALCVDRLKYETKHTFMTCGQMLQDVNKRLATLPEWKRVTFSDRHLEVDREALEPAIVFREEEDREYTYLRPVYEAERTIETTIRRLAGLSDIRFKSPVTEQYWRDLLFNADSKLAEKGRAKYEDAIETQAAVCAQVFSRPISVISGAAGTGKTTIIDAILRAIDKAHGEQATFLLLAPTGKAADRIREKTGKDASTVHAFLAKRGWLNKNLTLKTTGGLREEDITTYVIDEASMLDLELTATLFRAIQWSNVQRIILVGDPNQLPPIGRGRVFADIIDWLQAHYPDSVGELTVNLRQMENTLTDQGTAILELASIFVRNPTRDQKDQADAFLAEKIFKKFQDLPADGSVDKDLRVVYWNEAEDLLDKLINRMIADMEADSGEPFDETAAYKLWAAAVKGEDGQWRPDYHQVLTPYRHEEFGTETINLRIQQEARGGGLDRVGQLAGVTLFDKVLQYRNRGASEPIWAYDYDIGDNQRVNIFNGELGFVTPHGLDGKKWRSPHFHLTRFQVRFSRKENLGVGYGRKLGTSIVDGKTLFLPNENPEDNLELAYAISVHKAQGSEFDRVYFVVPKHKIALLSPELFYTGVTRATRHCTIFLQEDITPLLRMRRPESSHLVGINSSLFEFAPVPDGFELLRREGYLEEYKIHRTLADFMVRSKSEVIIANMLFERDVTFFYEKPLYASDGSFYLPDFTLSVRGEEFYWEHLGMLDREDYQQHWELKQAWYERHFPGQLVTTEESGNLSIDAVQIIDQLLT